MSASKKTSKKKVSLNSKISGSKIYYSFFLLFFANVIVFSFFAYFIHRLYASKIDVFGRQQMQVVSIPKLDVSSEIEVTAASYIVYDPLTRTVVLSKNPNMRLSPASSIKILTALVALDQYDLNSYLSGISASYDESKMGLYIGEEISVENLLYGLLLISGNDAAKTLAQNYPGGSDAFVKAMNNKAFDLKLTESMFFDPSGYLDNNYSTAFDMARLGSYAMKNGKIREIVGTKNKVVFDRYGLTVHPLINLNELLNDRNVTGIKTGFTNEAGGVLLTSYVHSGREIIIVVMKSEDRFSDTRKIISEVEDKIYYSEVPSGV